MRSETLTLVLVNLAGIMERADESLLPGVYRKVGAALHTDPTGLGSLTLIRSAVQSCCYPVAAYLATRHDRARVIALGAFLWAAATFLVAVSSTFLQVAISRGLNVVGLAIVIPAIQSLIADCTDESNRGMAFGWLQLTGNLGSIFGSLCSFLIASTSFLGIPGWRIAFHLVGLVSVVVGILVQLFASDPQFSDDSNLVKDRNSHKPFWSDVKDLVKESKSVIRILSFQIIVAQGVFGSFSGSALSFAPMWLELIGFSHSTTALLMTVYIIAFSLGGLFGGWMGDVLAKHLPNSGRIILSQISTASAIPLAAILLLALPDDPSTAFMHGLVLFIMGLCTSWCAPATNNPIFAEIVPEKSRTSIYALDNSFESILASFAPPLVDRDLTDRENAASLAKALYAAMGIPMAICCFIYSFLYCTYWRDREHARMDVLTEMQQIEVDSPYTGEDITDLDASIANGAYEKARSTIDRDYGTEEWVDLDDNDEKSLLSRQQTLTDIGE
ncbi:hypothetical protein EUGRSUZ_H04800 [Eucalyptus grandis]|uniref:Uncharacterized protein n=2 Tax=Eucalyptus grandis TaxID=71139 RepID=A0ACC3JY80_EUCGR|nr:hypothetical protein EUGRSUZ_H04800 [Eucalyptus grandis]